MANNLTLFFVLQDSDWGLTSSPDIHYTTPRLLSFQSKALPAAQKQRQKPPSTYSQSQSFASSTEVLAEGNAKVNVRFPQTQPPVSSRIYLREKSQSPLPEPTRSPELPPFDLVGVSGGHPKPLKRALTYGGVSSPLMPRIGSPNLLRACTSPELLYQAKSAPASPNLSLHSRRLVMTQNRGGGRGRGGSLPQGCLMLCKSNSETNLANIDISISLASSVEGLSGSSCHSGELACDHNSSHYNVSPVQSDSEGEGNIMEADTPTVPSSSQATGERGGGEVGHGDGGGEVDLPPLRQEELAMVSMSVGGRLPHLTLLLGMEYAEYENIASAVGSSQETQALQVSLVHLVMKRRMGGGVRMG